MVGQYSRGEGEAQLLTLLPGVKPVMCNFHLLLTWLLVAFAAVTPAAAAEPVNLVANGDFVQVVDGQPAQWTTSGSEADVEQRLTVEQDTDGRRFARLVCTRCEQRGTDSHAMLAQNGHVTLHEGRQYTFSCRLRATGLAGRAVSIALQETNGWHTTGLYTEFNVGPAWQQYHTLFQASRDVSSTGRLQIWFAEPGTLDVADVRIVEEPEQPVQFTDTVVPAGGRNLVPNGSFELGGAGWSSMGRGVGWGDLDSLHGTIEPGGTQGSSFLRVSLGGEYTPVLYFDYFQPLVRRELRVLTANLGWIRVEPGAAYTLSCDMRASVAGARGLLGARAQDPASGRTNHYSQPVSLTTSWHRYTHTFRPEQEWVFVFAGPDLDEEQRVDVDIDAIQLEKADQATPFVPRTPVEFALEPSRPAGIFVAGEAGALLLRLSNHSEMSATCHVDFHVSDFLDQPVALPPVVVDVPPHTSLSHAVPLPTDWQGYYRIHAASQSGSETATSDLRIAIVPPRAGTDSVCGINHAFVSADRIRLARKAGVSWYRDWSLKWQHIEPSPGEYHWEVGDAQIDRVLHEGVNVLPLLPPFPSANWNSDAPDSLAVGTSYPANRLRASFAPKNPQDLAAFVGQAVHRYQDRIHIWEFLNEPIFTSYSLSADREGKLGGTRYRPADYVALLKVAAQGMRSTDPTCRIIGGIAGGPATFTREVIEAGCLDYVDIFNLHIYPGQRAPEGYAQEMQDLLAMMDAHGGRKPIWITEFSYYGADNLPRHPFLPRTGSWSEERLLESERQCADYTLRFMLMMFAQGVEKVFLHSGATGRVNAPNYECALFDSGGTPRKLLPALALLTDLLGERPVCLGHRPLAGLGHAVAFETGTGSLVALWTEGDEAGLRIVIPADDGTSVVDTVGRPRAAGSVKLTSSPIYLLGPPGHAQRLWESVHAVE